MYWSHWMNSWCFCTVCTLFSMNLPLYISLDFCVCYMWKILKYHCILSSLFFSLCYFYMNFIHGIDILFYWIDLFYFLNLCFIFIFYLFYFLFVCFLFFYYFIFKLYKIVLVMPNIIMNMPQLWGYIFQTFWHEEISSGVLVSWKIQIFYLKSYEFIDLRTFIFYVNIFILSFIW